MRTIYLLGSLNCDLTIRAPYLPEAGETLKGGDFLMTPGGKGANQAYAAANLGGHVKMAGAVGKDAFGDLLLESLSSVGADLCCVRRILRNTGVAMITVINGDNRIILDEGANAEVGRADVDALLGEAQAGDLFVVQLENPLPVVLYALESARARGLTTIFNPAPATAEAAPAVAFSDIITPNRKELKLLSGEEDVEAGCRRLLQMGAGNVLVTLGKRGSLLYTSHERQEIACVDVGEAVDTTAAGDTYCGALAVRLAEGADLMRAARFASLASGITVTRRGAQISIPDRKEAEDAARRLHLTI